MGNSVSYGPFYINWAIKMSHWLSDYRHTQYEYINNTILKEYPWQYVYIIYRIRKVERHFNSPYGT